MNRKLKALGLALVAVFAMAAVSASAASAADEFHSEQAHTLLSGTQVGEDVFTTNAGTVKCKKATYEGTQSAATTTTQTVTPSYSECIAFGFVNAAIDVNGCQYVFHAEPGSLETADKTVHASWGKVDIVCPGSNAITVTTSSCWVTVGSQNGLKNASFKEEGAGKTRDVKVKVSITEIKYTQDSKNFPGCTGGAGTFTNGTYTGEATVKGFNTTSEQIGVWVS